METLIEALKKEAKPAPSEEMLRWFLSCGEMRHYPGGSLIVETGEIVENLFCVVSGIIKVAWNTGHKEENAGFASTGTILISPKGFYNRERAFFFIEACQDCKIMVWPKRTIMEMVSQSHEFSSWLLSICLSQFYATEMKLSTLQGNAIQRYDILAQGQNMKEWSHIANRPNITKEVSSKDLASYLGITPSYLSNIRKQSLMGERSKRNKTNENGETNGETNGEALSGSTTPISHKKVKKRFEEYLLNLIMQDPHITIKEIQEKVGLSSRRIKQYLSDFKAAGILSREGNNRSGYWKIN